MFAPAMAPDGAKNIRMNLPNRLELLFRMVWALPNASRMGLAWRIWRSKRPSPTRSETPNPISSASLPLKLDERGNPIAGAVELDFWRATAAEEDSASEGTVALAMAARY